VKQSVRTTLSASTRTEGFLNPASLLTLVYPDYYGVIGGNYRGPEDITQYYFYAGLLLVPLALAGLANKRVRSIGALFLAFCIWYAAGRAGGLYYLVAHLPGFSSVRAPVNIWFVPGLGLALLAGAGFVIVTGKWKIRWLPAALVALTFCDLFYWNSARNPLAYARYSFDELYGNKEDLFERTVGGSLPPLSRFWAPDRLTSFGPMNHPLDARVETTYGYGPLMLERYGEFTSAMRANPRLRDDLNVSRAYAVMNGQAVIGANPGALARVTFPKQIRRDTNAEDGSRALAQLDPANSALTPADLPEVHQDASATVEILDHGPGWYRMRYRAASDSLLRISEAFFPGWQARVDGRDLTVHCIDHALMGVIVPAGSRELSFTYHSTYFAAGAGVSLVSLAACLAALVWAHRRKVRQ
jgi:hypothetical protein